jgi:hypothetical protein
MLELCAEAFSMIVSDTTGNVKKCRRLICERWGWILNCPDPAHQLNLMMKDLIVGSKKFPAIKPFKAVRSLKYSTKVLKLTVKLSP